MVWEVINGSLRAQGTKQRNKPKEIQTQIAQLQR